MEIPVQVKYKLLSADFSASTHYKQKKCLETFMVTEFNKILLGSSSKPMFQRQISLSGFQYQLVYLNHLTWLSMYISSSWKVCFKSFAWNSLLHISDNKCSQFFPQDTTAPCGPGPPHC